MWLRLVIASVLTIGFLVGIRMMQSPVTARRGNALGAASMALAIIFVLGEYSALGNARIWLLLAAGAGLGFILGERVRMVEMPQMVGLLNGLGGAASALVAAASGAVAPATGWFFWLTAAFALALGTVTFSGSVVAALKLQGTISGRPVYRRLDTPLLLAMLAVIVACVTAPTLLGGPAFALLLPLNVLASLVVGYVGASRIGGADMPVIISFLNSLSGIAAAVCGLAVADMLPAGVGALVGVAGMILTRIMCVAINRSLLGLVQGPQPAKTQSQLATPTGAAAVPAPSEGVATPGAAPETASPKQPEHLTLDELPARVRAAKRVIIVPGYGMAVAQAQHAVADLVSSLEAQGKSVRIAIHPVAGRMPGHMNVLLAEAGLDYEKFVDMDDINPEFAATDLVIVIGACDVVNPAARSAEGTPIYGMPVLRAEEAATVVVLNLNEKPGYSGVPNPLYDAPHCALMWGDAKETVAKVTAMTKE